MNMKGADLFMKKKTLIALSLCLACSFSSCGKEEVKDTGTPLSWDNITVEEYLGSTEEIPYEIAMDKPIFKASFESYTDKDNVLQLKSGTFEDAAVAKPFKSALVKDNEVISEVNDWRFPIVHDGTIMGIINYDMRSPEMRENGFFGGEEYAPVLNEALKKGSVAVFNTIDATYGICEDNTIVILEGTEPYDGELTFEQVNKGYNLVTAESVRDSVRTADSFKSEDEK